VDGSAFFAHGSFNIALCVPLGEIVALVIELFALAQRKLHLHAAVLQIHAQGDQRQTLLHYILMGLADLLLVHQEPLGSHGFGIEIAALFIGADVHVVDEHFAVLDGGVAVFQIALAEADGFDLGALQFKAAFPAFEDEIIMPGFSVLNYDLHALLRHVHSSF